MDLYEICKDIFNEDIKDKILLNLSLCPIKRLEHSLFVYYIGKYIYSRFKNDFIIEVNYNGNVLLSFDLIWKYLAIYHDIGYDYQNFELYNYNKIVQAYYCCVLDIDKQQNNLWLKELKYEDLMTYYLINCIDPHNINEPCEHGILGSYLFHEKFYKKPPEVYHNMLSWNHLVLAVTLTMAQHNIWDVPEDKVKKNNIDLESLNCSKKSDGSFVLYHHEPFSYNNSFLPFYLCLIDSIEPIKLFYDKENTIDIQNAMNFLKAINLEVQEIGNSHIIFFKIDITKLNLNTYDSMISRWKDNILKCSSFLNVKVNTNDNEIKIYF